MIHELRLEPEVDFPNLWVLRRFGVRIDPGLANLILGRDSIRLL